MYPQRNDSFLYSCKESFFLQLNPLHPQIRHFKIYQTLAGIAQAYFAEGQFSQFLSFLVEEKYHCNVWAAHLILEFGNPDMSMVNICREIIAAFEASEARQMDVHR